MAQAQRSGEPSERSSQEPMLEEVADALAHHLRTNGAVPTGIAGWLAAEHGWGGRLMDVLAVLTEDADTMGYLAGGRHKDEVMTWLALWADTPFNLEEIRAIVAAGGWDPEPFVPVVEAGLLEALLHRADGTPRIIRGERAGAWLSDQFALADEREVLSGVRALLDEELTELLHH